MRELKVAKKEVVLPQRITIKVKDKNGEEYETGADIIPIIDVKKLRKEAETKK